jgi:hypothetical protein
MFVAFSWMRHSTGRPVRAASVAVLLAMAILAVGADRKPEPSSSSQSRATPSIGISSTNAPASPSRRLFTSGIVAKLDSTNRWMEVRTTNGLERVRYTTNANVMLTGQRASVADVRVGDRVGVVARSGDDGEWQLISLRIGARPPGDGNVKRLDAPTTD